MEVTEALEASLVDEVELLEEERTALEGATSAELPVDPGEQGAAAGGV